MKKTCYLFVTINTETFKCYVYAKYYRNKLFSKTARSKKNKA